MWEKFSNNEYHELNLDDKINILELSIERVDELKKIKVKELSFHEDTKELINKMQVINVDDVIGLARPVYGDISWLDILDNKYCHKNRNFDLYNKETFDYVLMNEVQDDYPVVIEYKKKYYIAGNGLHRLTMAKCLGNKKARVIVRM